MHFAAMDLGSNSFHLLLAARGARGELVKLGSYKEVLKLGSSLGASGQLPEAAIARALDALGTMLALARSFRAAPIAVGTSALRSAKNGREFLRAAKSRFDIDVQILSGAEEAMLVYRGARSALSGLPGKIAVVDLGGGSVELALGDEEQCSCTESLPLGFLRFDRSSESEIRERVARDARAAAEHIRHLSPEACVASGGTARALAKILGPSARVEGRPVRRDELRSLSAELFRAGEARLTELGVDPARRDAIGVAATVLSALIDALGAPSVRISPGGLREGVLLRQFAAVEQRADPSGVRAALRAHDLSL